MQLLIGTMQLLLALVLQVAPAQISYPPEKGPTKVMTFQEVWAKSMCQPMEQLVDVEQEYPGEVEYTYMPACVPLKRCSGCCGDEYLECQATLESNITLQVIRIQQASMNYVEITFVEHQRCECGLKIHKKSINNKSSDSVKNKLRRMKHKKAADGCGK
ncbi:vascular endothelial growth factor A-like isoform X2 [Takifugu rubripes]|nr:vascular endothelial growth factor A-like isoform X2 [Takifugu rubripes]